MPELVRCVKCKANVPKQVRGKSAEDGKVVWSPNVGKDGVCVPCMEKATEKK